MTTPYRALDSGIGAPYALISMSGNTIITSGPVAKSPRVKVIMFTDLVGSTALKEKLGAEKYWGLRNRHDFFLREAMAAAPSGEVLADTGDGFFISFNSVQEGVRAALIFQWLMRHEPWAHPFAARVGLHLGEVEEGISQVTQQVNFVSSAIDLASRTMSLAVGGQILLTRLMYDAARPALREHPQVGAEGVAPGLRWMSHGHYQFKGAGEPVEIFEVGAEGVAPLCPPPDTEKARRCQSSAVRAGGGRRWWMIPLAAMVVLLAAGGWFWKQRNNPMVAVEREQIEREVARLAADPPVAIKEHPVTIRMVDLVQPADNAGFDVLEDHRVIDLRGWKEVPPDKVSELYSPVTMSCRRQIKKNAVTNRFEVELRTTGLDVFWNSDGAYPFTVEAQRGESFVGLQPVKVRKISVDVAAVPVGHEFSLRDTSTYWNSVQTEEDQWFGVTGYDKCPAVTLLILFPPGRPFKSYHLSVTPTNRGKPVDFAGPRLVLADEKQTWIHWEIPDPVPGHVYRLQWQW